MTPLEIMLKSSKRNLPDGRELFHFSLTDHVFEHSQFTEAIATIAQVHQKRIENKSASGLLITADSGFGKSVILEQYQSFFPKKEVDGKTLIPVINFVMPSRPTDFSLATAVLEAMGYPAAMKKENAANKTRKLYELFNQCNTQLLLVDELHHLDKSRNSSEFYVALNWIKNLISVGNVSVVATGLPHASNVIQVNKELRRRFQKKLPLFAFEHLDDASFMEFRSVLKQIGELLPYECEIPLHEQNLARRILVASNGLLDYVCRLIDGAVFIAQYLLKPIINQEVFAASFRENIWLEVPEKLNPFHPASSLRKLNKFGEPYHSEDKRMMEVL